MNRIFLIFIFLVFALTTCIDPYILKLNEYESLLVVDGLISDESIPYTIKLSRTFQEQGTLPVMVSHAVVNVMDENGYNEIFYEQQPGIYRSNPASFTGRIGGTYTLNIKTADGLEYESEPCLLTEAPGIDSIYFSYDREFFNNGSEEEEGIRIFLDADNENSVCRYFRWEFDEVWKFSTPYPVAYKYLGGSSIASIPVENHICWKYGQSNDILIHSTEQQQTNQVSRQPLKFIASARSDRLRRQYSILVKQYSLSKSEYEFWHNLRQVTESGGDIFGKQPYSVIGNIRCVNRENEKILGYFQVSALKQKRRYITRTQLQDIDIPYYSYPCITIENGPIDYIDPEAPSPTPPPTFDEIYNRHIAMGYVFVYPLYNGLSLERLVFSTKVCSDCSQTGDPDKPDFWVDLN